MSSELDDVARSLFNGQIPSIWRRLAPDTLKSLGNWMIHFEARLKQYNTWVSRLGVARNSVVVCKKGRKIKRKNGNHMSEEMEKWEGGRREKKNGKGREVERGL